MKSITIHRNKGYYGRIRALTVLVDGQKIAVLKAGESTTVEIPNEAEEMHGKMDWGKTEVFDVRNLEPGQSLHFEAYFTLNPLRSLGLWPIPIRIVLGSQK